jgi:hypothetical protein
VKVPSGKTAAAVLTQPRVRALSTATGLETTTRQLVWGAKFQF